MPNQQTFEGHLAPVAWEALSRGWNARRDEDGNLLIEFEGDECCLCTTAPHEASGSNQALGLGPGEDSFVVVASVPVVGAVPLSAELLEEVRAWSDARKVPVGTEQVVPVKNPDLQEDAVRVTVEYRIAGGGFRPEEVAAVAGEIAAEVGALRDALNAKFDVRVQDAALTDGFDTPLVAAQVDAGDGPVELLPADGEHGDCELVKAPDARVHQMDLFSGPITPWRVLWRGGNIENVLPEVYREIYKWSESEARNHKFKEPNPALLIKACARRNPRLFSRRFGAVAFRRVMALTNEELDRGSAYNVRHLLRRVAEKKDPTVEMIPLVLDEVERMMPELLDLVTDRDQRDPEEVDKRLAIPFATREEAKDKKADTELPPLEVPSRPEIERELKKRVKGQDEAAEQVASSLAMSFRGLKGNSPRPKGVFMFAGPTGVGKTEMAKAIADTIYGPGDNLIRLDMSEYREHHTAARLVGSPPGYIGYNEPAGWLTTRVIETPRAVLLLDEFEKAHEAVWQTFLQIFEDGRLTDGRGAVADFSELVIVLTSNLGSRAAAARATGFGQVIGAVEGAIKDPSSDIFKAIREALPPELFNRIDGTFSFRPLDRELLVEIARAKLKAVKGELAAVGYELTFSSAVAPAVAAFDADPALGARPMLRAIDRLIREPLVDLPPGKYKVRAPGGVVQVAA